MNPLQLRERECMIRCTYMHTYIPCEKIDTSVRVASFFLTQYTKTENHIPNVTTLPNCHNITKLSQHYQIVTTLPNCHNITKLSQHYQMTINIPKLSTLRPSKIYPNWDFWLKNIPSGNPASAASAPPTARKPCTP
jgi:hypothetical protein